MIIKSYEIQKNLSNFLKYNFYLLYGENNGLKKEIRELCKTPQMTTSSELVTELDKKIKSSKRYYR